jgi:hypothetical protein
MKNLARSTFANLLSIGLLANPLHAQTSALWGSAGELWSPSSRLPDFSFAGYRSSDVPLPAPAVTANVKDYGAVGNGTTDDTAAFTRALAAMPAGALMIPSGRYKLTAVLKINRSGIVLRGAGADKTTLFFPNNLTQAVGDGSTHAPGGSWSWSGGFISFVGGDRDNQLTTVTASAARGDTKLTLASTSGLSVGQAVHLNLTDVDGSLANYLHANQMPAGPEIWNMKLVNLSFKIAAINGHVITMSRPLRTDVRTVWTPKLYSDLPTVQDVGVESLTIDFAVHAYAGHHLEPGYNAIDFQRVHNGWVRDVDIRNADNGVILREETKFCTITGVNLYTDPGRTSGGFDGHQGLLVADLSQDNLFENFRIEARYIHDTSVTSMACGNVFSKGYARDYRCDHHRKAPYENLFTEMDAGVGSDIWYSGGDDEAGPHTGARETFWNIRSMTPESWPSWAIMMNFIGMFTNNALLKTTTSNWNEPYYGSLQPVNLFQDQLENRHHPDRTTPQAPAPAPPPSSGGQDASLPVVTPNPWVGNKNRNQNIRIEGLKMGSVIELHNTRGDLTRTLSAPLGRTEWDLTTNAGRRASTGTYLYVAELPDGATVNRRIVIVR